MIAHVNDHQITARLFGQHMVEEGQELRFGFKPQSAYHFDDAGLRLF